MTATIPDEGDLRHWLVDYLVTTIGCNPERGGPGLVAVRPGCGIPRRGRASRGNCRSCWVGPSLRWSSGSIPRSMPSRPFLLRPNPKPNRMRSRPPGLGARVDEPIAVIGMGCRFPGGIAGPDELWDFLCEGRSAVSEVPSDRWLPFDDGSPEVAAALAETTRWGSFLDDIDAFDAEFFEISPREAARMDPQQRFLLEVAWEALEHAGIPAV